MKTLIKLACFISILALTSPGWSDSHYIINTSRDWSVEADQARVAGIPIMVIFSTDHCPYCVRLREEVLKPLIQNGALKGKVLIREFNIEEGGKITDFDGERIRSGIFVSRYSIYATPTVVLVDHRGRQLTEAIVGFNEADSYTHFLDEAISSAVMSLAAFNSPRFAGLH
ncbi:MAG: thioredoxin fold domain-containing protein [Chromatiaceae bacterium]|nr:thioredoxin fold domain-containing protein [Chromatiaceae bacterium]MCP5444264.1 thioredoxin fold domain-containing protein [Chromatiaceae bacterium]